MRPTLRSTSAFSRTERFLPSPFRSSLQPRGVPYAQRRSRILLCFVVTLCALTFGFVFFSDSDACWGRCAYRALGQAQASLLALDGANKALTVSTLVVPASRPFTFVTCTNCGCDVCAMALSNGGAFAPVESLIWEYFLTSDACDGSKSVVDVGANAGYFTLLASKYPCTHVIAMEPQHAPRVLAATGVRLNGVASRVTLLPFAVGAREGSAQVDTQPDKWGLSSVHTQTVATKGAVEVVPISSLTLTKDVLLIKVDTEGGEVDVLPGLWSFFDEGRTCDALLVEVKQWNGREKRQLLRHLARTGNFSYVFNYVEQYHIQLSKLSDISLNGRLLDATNIITAGRFEAPLPAEDFLFTRFAMPDNFVRY